VTPDPDATWQRIRGELRQAVTDHTYHLWLEPLRLRATDGAHLVVGAPDEIRSWVGSRYARVLETCVQAVLGPEATVSIGPIDAGPPRAGATGGAQAKAPPVREPAVVAETFNPKYTFEQFVIGDANRLAHAAALAVAELPGQAYNPLFIYGPPGLGKTHLLHAIANYLAAHEPGVTVRYTTVEAFTNHFIHALKAKAIERFKSLYRDTDVLLIDDVQFLVKKERTEEELFHTFNALYETGAQLVLTSDRLPGDLRDIEDRLRERFASGLVTDVRPPDVATRLTILRKRVAHDGIPIESEAALTRIAERVDANIRQLEGALIRIVAYNSLTRRPIDEDLVDEVIDGLYPGSRPPVRRTVVDVQQACCETFGVTLDELVSPVRTARVTWPRHVAMYLARELTEASLPAIGREFGGRNHATVLHAWRRTSARMAQDREAFDAVHRVCEQLGERSGERSDDEREARGRKREARGRTE
jgi:chromosomal replication initiator protein